MLKFTNQQKTAARFFNSSFGLAAPEDWDSIGDGPTRTKVKEWLAAGNTPQPADPEPAPVDQTNMNNLPKQMKAILGCVAQVGGLTNVQMIAMFKAKMDLLP